MLKKLSILCLCLCLLGGVALAEATTPTDGPTTLLATVGGGMTMDWDSTDYEKDKVFVSVLEQPLQFWLAVPAGDMKVEDMHWQAVRITLNTMPEIAEDGTTVVTADSIDLLGAINGAIVELTSDKLVTSVYEEGIFTENAPTVDLIINSDSYLMEEFNPGDTVQIVYDPATMVVLAVLSSNG